MNCREAQKHLFALADDQLGAHENYELRGHVAECARCARIIDDHRAARRAIRRAVETIAVPAGLHDRIRHRVRKLEGRGVLRWRVLVPAGLAAAASVALAINAVRFTAESFTPVSGPTDRIAAAVDKAAEDAVRFHFIANDSLARLREGRLEAAERLAAHYGDALAVVIPDLSGRGFVFQWAEARVVSATPRYEGVWAVYLDSAGERFSVFSLARGSTRDLCGPMIIADAAPTVRVVADDGRPVTVLTWADAGTQYLLIGPQDADELKAIKDAMQPPAAAPSSRSDFNARPADSASAPK